MLSALLSLSNLEWVDLFSGFDTPWLSKWASVSLGGGVGWIGLWACNPVRFFSA